MRGKPTNIPDSVLTAMVAAGMTQQAIADAHQCDRVTVVRLMQRRGIVAAGKPAPRALAMVRKQAPEPLPSGPANWLSGLGG